MLRSAEFSAQPFDSVWPPVSVWAGEFRLFFVSSPVQLLFVDPRKGNMLGSGTGLVGQEPSQRWGSLFPQNAWESALPAACRPPQTGPPITPGQLLCLFLSTPLFSRANPRSPDREFGIHDGEDRQSNTIFVTAMVWLVYNSRHDPTALKPLRENRPQHATVIHL